MRSRLLGAAGSAFREGFGGEVVVARGEFCIADCVEGEEAASSENGEEWSKRKRRRRRFLATNSNASTLIRFCVLAVLHLVNAEFQSSLAADPLSTEAEMRLVKSSTASSSTGVSDKTHPDVFVSTSYPCARGSVPFETFALLAILIVAFCGVATAALLQSGGPEAGSIHGSSQQRSVAVSVNGFSSRPWSSRWRDSLSSVTSLGRRRTGGGRSGGGAKLRFRVLLLIGLSAILRAALLSGMLSLLLLPLFDTSKHATVLSSTGVSGRTGGGAKKSAINHHITNSMNVKSISNGRGGGVGGLWPSPWQCAGVDVWGRVMLRFVPALFLLLAFLLLVCFLIRLHAAASLQRSPLPATMARGAGIAGATAFALGGGLTYRRATQHLFQRCVFECPCSFACLLVGGMFAGTGILWALYGFLVLRDLKRRDLTFHRPLLSQQEAAEAREAEEELSEFEDVRVCTWNHQHHNQQQHQERGISEALERQVQRATQLEASVRPALLPPGRRSRSDEAQLRLLLLVCCCPPLLFLLGMYLLVVGLGGRHLYPRAVQRDHQQITFDLFMLLAAELVPSVLVVAAFSSTAPASQSQRDTVSSDSSKQAGSASPSHARPTPPSSLFAALPGSTSSNVGMTQGSSAFLQLQRHFNREGVGSSAVSEPNSTSEFSAESQSVSSEVTAHLP